MRRPRILICPLDWGIGHATRCVPVINLLLDSGADVLVAADGRPLEFLKNEFPGLTFIKFPGLAVKYPRNSNSMAVKMLLHSFKFLPGVFREHFRLQQIIKKHEIQAVISDNRFGLWSKKAFTVYMTHQLHIKTPQNLQFLEPLLQRLHGSFIKKYNQCWIPDIEGDENLSGELSHINPLPANARFIGPLSRFRSNTEDTAPGSEIDILAIVSGPEPQRTIFENILKKQLKQSGEKAVMVCGKTEINSVTQDGNLTLYSHLKSDDLSRIFLKSALIISRPGYSTIMDLAATGKKAVFVPTPGQTEQEYLAEKFHKEGVFFSVSQKDFDLKIALEKSVSFPGIRLKSDYSALQDEISFLLKQIANQ